MTDLENLEVRRKRLLYRAEHRGTQELDILIGGYVADHLDSLDHAQLDRLEALLDNEETDLQAWIMGQRDIPADADHRLIDAIREHQIKRVGT